MTLYERKSKFSGFSERVGRVFSKVGLSPNQWTLFALVPTFIAVYFLINEAFLLAAVFFIIASFVDIIDGSVARVSGKVSNLGAYLDTVIDRYVEGIIIFGLLFASLPALGLAGFSLPAAAWIVLYLFGAMMTTYSKAAAKEKGLIGVELKGGLLERAERLIILFIGILLGAVNPLYLSMVIALLAVLTNVSALQRIRKAVKLIKCQPEAKLDI
ncbi:MAG: CDP-alcohol phosphatidyltransferase family protein [Candidatus Aenigmarchaeota archaeon]|nr:CDP-alcohol phosphatidyltransferase family protein [Candidatus Aenigmarchaeota archaeon]